MLMVQVALALALCAPNIRIPQDRLTLEIGLIAYSHPWLPPTIQMG